MKVTDITSLARYILSPECTSICVLTGAGISVGAGIPDFRSPGGMYETLRPELITATEQQRKLMSIDPTYVVSWDIFKENQYPYMEVRRPFILGSYDKKWKATIGHRFFELLHVKLNKLTRIYTQNIDGLDYQCTNIPTDKIIPVHGTIRKASCEGCGNEMNYEKFCNKVRTSIKDIYNIDNDAPKESKPIVCEYCNKPLIKPQTVLFGRNLPQEFFIYAQKDIPRMDILFIAGTSLVVSPANSIAASINTNRTKRIIVNREPVGIEFGINYNNNGNDFFAQGDCDDIFLELIKELGWVDELNIDDLPPECIPKVEKAKQDTAYTKWF